MINDQLQKPADRGNGKPKWSNLPVEWTGDRKFSTKKFGKHIYNKASWSKENLRTYRLCQR